MRVSDFFKLLTTKHKDIRPLRLKFDTADLEVLTKRFEF